MGYQRLQSSSKAAWELTRKQHGVITRAQLLELGFSAPAIKHRLEKRRLHVVWRGVYAVGRPELTQRGRWMAAVLVCGPDAALSHDDAAALWKIRSARDGEIHVSIVVGTFRARPRVTLHRRTAFETTRRHGIPVTAPVCTLVDLAARLTQDQLEAAVNQADKLGLIDPEALRKAIEGMRRPGARALRRTLDRRTFVLSDSKLERLFLALVRRAGLPEPRTQERLNGFDVDFYWPEVGLVVETDGLTYHRTPAEQARDRLRDQAHTAAGLTCLRFTHDQVKFDPGHVVATLAAVSQPRP